MRLYYMTGRRIAVEHILPERRLELSLYSELNDPFELLPCSLTQGDLRRVINVLRSHFTNTKAPDLL